MDYRPSCQTPSSLPFGPSSTSVLPDSCSWSSHLISFQAPTFLHFVVVQLVSHVWLFVTPWLQHARLPCPSASPGVCSSSCPSSRWCHPTISSSVVPFSSCLQSFPASESFLMSQPFASLWFCFPIFHLSAVSDGPSCYQKGADRTKMMHNSGYVF